MTRGVFFRIRIIWCVRWTRPMVYYNTISLCFWSFLPFYHFLIWNKIKNLIILYYYYFVRNKGLLRHSGYRLNNLFISAIKEVIDSNHSSIPLWMLFFLDFDFLEEDIRLLFRDFCVTFLIKLYSSSNMEFSFTTDFWKLKNNSF